jgi:hypothetical protein
MAGKSRSRNPFLAWWIGLAITAAAVAIRWIPIHSRGLWSERRLLGFHSPRSNSCSIPFTYVSDPQEPSRE